MNWNTALALVCGDFHSVKTWNCRKHKPVKILASGSAIHVVTLIQATVKRGPPNNLIEVLNMADGFRIASNVSWFGYFLCSWKVSRAPKVSRVPFLLTDRSVASFDTGRMGFACIKICPLLTDAMFDNSSVGAASSIIGTVWLLIPSYPVRDSGVWKVTGVRIIKVRTGEQPQVIETGNSILLITCFTSTFAMEIETSSTMRAGEVRKPLITLH